MTDLEAATTAPAPVAATPSGVSAAAQVPASPEAKPETVDLTPWGEQFKDIKAPKNIIDKLPALLKSEHFTSETADMLTDAEMAKLYLTSEAGYRKAHNQRFETEQASIKKAEARLKELDSKEQAIVEREKELAELDGENYFHRNPKVREKERYARKQVEDGRWTQEEADEYVKPYVETAKTEFEAAKEARQTQIKVMMEQNAEIGKAMFPELDPHMAACLVDGFVISGQDPKSAAQIFRAELDRVVDAAKARAVSDYLKELNNKQPPGPGTVPDKPIPNATEPNEIAASIQRGRTLWGVFGK